MSSTSVLSTGASGVGSGNLLQITGLASNLDTTAIINALMQADRAPLTHLTNQQKALQARNSQLTSLQTALQQVALNAQSLGSPGLFANTQTATSSDTTRVAATTTAGARVGGYQVAVTQLANSSYRTFNFTSPAADETFSIDGKSPVTVKAGSSSTDFVNAINSDSNQDVWAVDEGNGKVVLSSRSTGAPSGGYITFGTQPTSLTDTGDDRAGQDAIYSVDGGAATHSASNTVANAMPGVTLTLNSVTTTSGPVTVNVTPPAPSTSGIETAVKTFVDSYNAIIDQVNAQTSEVPSKGDPTQGTLYGDNELTDLLSYMRQQIYTPNSALTKIQSLADIGITTGAAAGSSPFSQDSVSGKLKVDNTKLDAAINANPGGVKAMLQSWSSGFATLVNGVAAPGGSMDQRIQGDTSQLSDLANQIADMNAMLVTRQTALQTQFANLETALQQGQSESNWLMSQISRLP